MEKMTRAQAIREFFGIPKDQMKAEYAKLTSEDRDELMAGIVKTGFCEIAANPVIAVQPMVAKAVA